MLKHHVPYLPKTISSYSEPFFGAGAMFLHIMEHYSPKEVVINDIYPGIVNVLKAIKNQPEEFIKEMKTLESGYLKTDRRAFYYEIRRRHAWEYQEMDDLVEAAHHYFLQKTSFNGILQFNKSENNRFGTPFGLGNEKDSIFDPDLVRAWSRLLQNVTIMCEPYGVVPVLDFTYCDPPYLNSFTQYGQEWNQKKTLSLINRMDRSMKNGMICNRDNNDGFFEANKKGFNLLLIPVTYTAGRRKKTPDGFVAKKATEVLLWR
jgi:DNA adenine methylase